jgi:hypothetical protein
MTQDGPTSTRVMYIPVAPMGVQLVGAIDTSKVPPSGRCRLFEIGAQSTS